MSDILQEICANTRVEVERRKKAQPWDVIDRAAKSAPPVRGFTKSLQTRIKKGEVGFITEVKKASPSAGVIRATFSPAEIAKEYESAGAACLSVLTDGHYFQGKNEDLIAARKACALPVLRKDFMLDVWQVVESRAMGADCILIIMATVDDVLAAELHASAITLGMDVLIETHNKAEMERGLKLPSGLIGINNRNLKSLKVDLAVTEELVPLVPKERLLVCESGIATSTDVKRMRTAGAHCFLVGESLLRQADAGTALKALQT